MITATATLQSVISVTAQIVSREIGSCAAASFTLEDEDSNVLDSGTIPSGDAGIIVAPNGTVTINGVGVGEVLSNGDLPLVVNLNGSPSGSLVGGVWEVESDCPSITVSLDDSTPYFNQEITITAAPSAGYSPTLYTFIATNGTYNEVIQVGASNTANWNVRLAGNVSIIVQATDGSSEVYTSTSIDIEGFIFSLMPWAGSNTFDIAIPTSSAGTYNCVLNVAAEDGTLISNNAITTWNDANWSQTMPTSGRVYVQITGTFSRIDTSNDWQDILEEVYQWNDVTIGQSDWMSGGNIRRVSATDAPDLTLAANRMRNMFRSSKITHLNVSSWDLSIINDLFQFAAFTQVEIVGLTQFWSTFTGGSLFRAFRQMPPQDYHLRDITWTNVNNGGGFLQSSDGTTLEDYEQALININADAPTTSFTLDAGGSQYRSGSAAETAKNAAITNYGITFIDGGAV